MFLTSLCHLQCLFLLVTVNTLSKSTLKLLFFLKSKYKKIIQEKIKMKETKNKKIEVEGSKKFSSYLVTKFAWRPNN